MLIQICKINGRTRTGQLKYRNGSIFSHFEFSLDNLTIEKKLANREKARTLLLIQWDCRYKYGVATF